MYPPGKTEIENTDHEWEIQVWEEHDRMDSGEVLAALEAIRVVLDKLEASGA